MSPSVLKINNASWLGFDHNNCPDGFVKGYNNGPIFDHECSYVLRWNFYQFNK
jgi:hypothetical protein